MWFDDATCAVRKDGCVGGTKTNSGREKKFELLAKQTEQNFSGNIISKETQRAHVDINMRFEK